MKKLDKAFINAKLFASSKLDRLAEKATGDETLIIKIMLMVVATALVILFKDTLGSIIKTLLTDPTNGLQKKITDMYSAITA